jgi:hypothetical protein
MTLSGVWVAGPASPAGRLACPAARDFERGLTAQASAVGIALRIDGIRRGDYVAPRSR